MTGEIAGIPFPLLHAAILALLPLNRPVTPLRTYPLHALAASSPSRRLRAALPRLALLRRAKHPALPRPHCPASS